MFIFPCRYFFWPTQIFGVPLPHSFTHGHVWRVITNFLLSRFQRKLEPVLLGKGFQLLKRPNKFFQIRWVECNTLSLLWWLKHYKALWRPRILLKNNWFKNSTKRRQIVISQIISYKFGFSMLHKTVKKRDIPGNIIQHHRPSL